MEPEYRCGYFGNRYDLLKDSQSGARIRSDVNVVDKLHTLRASVSCLLRPHLDQRLHIAVLQTCSSGFALFASSLPPSYGSKSLLTQQCLCLVRLQRERRSDFCDFHFHHQHSGGLHLHLIFLVLLLRIHRMPTRRSGLLSDKFDGIQALLLYRFIANLTIKLRHYTAAFAPASRSRATVLAYGYSIWFESRGRQQLFLLFPLFAYRVVLSCCRGLHLKTAACPSCCSPRRGHLSKAQYVHVHRKSDHQYTCDGDNLYLLHYGLEQLSTQQHVSIWFGSRRSLFLPFGFPIFDSDLFVVCDFT